MSIILDRLTWFPTDSFSSVDLKKIQDELTVYGRQFIGEDREVLLYEFLDNTNSYIGLPRNWAREKSSWLIPKDDFLPLKSKLVIDNTSCPYIKWSEVTFPEGFSWWPGQKDSVEKIVVALVSKQGALLEAAPGSGKGQPIDSLVLGPDGWVKIGDLKIGDKLIDPDTGGPCDVTGVFHRGMLPTYDVFFSDKTSVTTDSEHLWHVLTPEDRLDGKSGRIISTEQLTYGKLQDSDGKSKWFIPLSKPLLGKEKDFCIHPYLMGALLGNGSMTVGVVRFSTGDKDTLDRVTQLAGLMGVGTKYKGNYDYDLTIDKGQRHNELRDQLVRLGLYGKYCYEKWIPTHYLNASISQRLDLLRGLLDTDGEMGGGGNLAFSYSSSSEQLRDDVIFLIRSLGGTATPTHKKVPGYRDSYRAYCMLPEDIEPFYCKRKLSRWKKGQRVPFKAIRKVIRGCNKDIVCISVNSRRNLYITENYTVTHNTVLSLAIASYFHTPVIVLVHKSDLEEQWKETASKFFTGLNIGTVRQDNWDYKDKHVVVASMQTLASRTCSDDFVRSFGLIINDEAHTVAADTFLKALTLFPAKYRLGVSATFRRADKLECVWHYHIGHIEHKMRGKRLTGEYVQVPWKTTLQESECTLRGGNIHHPKIVNAISDNAAYNNWLVQELLSASSAGRKVLAVSDRVRQLELLYYKLKEKRSVGLYVGATSGETVDGKTKKIQTSKEHLQDAKKCDIILGSSKMFKEGTDCPELDTLFLLTPMTDIEQVVGRIQRLNAEKKSLLIIDPVFQTNYCKKLGEKRAKLYKKLGFVPRESKSESKPESK